MKAEMDVEGNFGNEGNVLLQGRHKGPMINGLYKKYIRAHKVLRPKFLSLKPKA